MRHGARGYVNGCRCERCTASNTKRNAIRRKERHALRVLVDGRLVAKSVPDEKHGSASTYSNWGCRCQKCSEAHIGVAKPKGLPVVRNVENDLTVTTGDAEDSEG